MNKTNLYNVHQTQQKVLTLTTPYDKIKKKIIGNGKSRKQDRSAKQISPVPYRRQQKWQLWEHLPTSIHNNWKWCKFNHFTEMTIVSFHPS